MSLQVWLPLNGDLHNQGCSDITVTNNGATVDNNGKIGKCYYFNGSSQYLQLNRSLGDIYSNDFSWCIWLKPMDDTRGIIFSEYASSGSSNVAFELLANRTIRVYWNGSPDWTFGLALEKNVWSHVAITKSTNSIKVYINGEFKKENTGTLSARSSTSCIRLGDDYRGGTSVSYMGYMNDARIYDHCLSAAEVKEIAQGLVLHYKLDDAVGFTDLIARNVNVTAYNNHGNTNNPTTITYLSQQYNGDRIIQYSATPNSSVISSIQGGMYSHGIYNWNRTFKANTKYVFWIYYKPITHLDTVAGGTASNIGGWTEIPPVAVGDGWYRVGQYRDGTVTTDKTDNIFVSYKTPSAVAGDNIIIYFASPHLLEGTTEIPPYDYPSIIIQDSSGYGNNGIINSNPTISLETRRYNYSISFDGVDDCIKIPFNDIIKDKNYTVSVWTYKTSIGTKNYQTILGGPSGFELEARSSSSTSPLYRIHNWGGGTTAYEFNKWNLFTFVHTDSNSKLYVNGELKITGTSANIPTGNYYIGAWNSVTGQNYEGLMSDFRIYCTALTADDILQLYHTGAKIDNKGNTHTYEFIEHQDNILFPVELSRTKLEFTNGLNRFTQANCQVTLTENGYHIYRPSNLTTSANGNTMYGGLKLVNQSTDIVSPYNATRDNIWNLQKGHSYILAFHAKGQSSNANGYLSFSNYMGWGVGGVSPTPTLIAANGIPADFQGEKDCYYAFTINDDIVKTSNDARAGYDGSSQYLSYRHFTFGWIYTNTGTLGTDVYLTNFRLYDITTHVAQFTKQGIANFSQFIEQMDKAQIRKNSELLSSEFIEL